MIVFLGLSCAQNQTTVVQNPIPVSKLKNSNTQRLASLKDVEVVATNTHTRQDLESGLYVEKRAVEIKASNQIGGGSLFDPDSKTVDFLRDNQILGVGSYVKLYVKEVRKRGQEEDDDKKALEAEDEDTLTDDLLGELPDFEPLKGMKDKVLPVIHARVMGRTKHGDFIIESKRSSQLQNYFFYVYFTAILPYEKVVKSNEGQTTDLLDVHFVERNDSEGYFEHNSIAWEDQYSLRYSGFAPVIKKAYDRLELSRKSLSDARERFKSRIASFQKDRETVANERTETLKENSDLKNKMNAQKEELDRVKQELQSLQQNQQPEQPQQTP
jgi:hypothetical protein